MCCRELVMQLGPSCYGTYVLEKTEILDLMEHKSIVEIVSCLLFVRLDATDVMRGATRQRSDEGVDGFLSSNRRFRHLAAEVNWGGGTKEGYLDLKAGSGWLLLGCGDFLGLGEETL